MRRDDRWPALLRAACLCLLVVLGLQLVQSVAWAQRGDGTRLTIALDGRPHQMVAGGALIGIAQSLAQARASSTGTRLSLSVEGRRHEIDAFGSLTQSGRGHPRATSITLEQRISVRGRSMWRTRAKASLRHRDNALKYAARWRHPPARKLLTVRVAARRGDRVLALSTAQGVRSGDPGTVFYSGECNAGAGEATGAVWRLTAGGGGFCDFENRYDGVWTRPGGKCDTSNAAAFPSVIHGQPIAELAGYSLGRLGPLYFLKNSPSWISQIHYILLFDPGNAADLSGCDANPDIAAADNIASWLARDPKNELVVMAGSLTSEDHHAGIMKHYFSKLSLATATTQVVVCDTGLSHDDLIKAYAWMVGAEPPVACPGLSDQWPVPRPPPKPLTPLQPIPTPSPAPLSAHQFHVMNATGGIYWRSAPDWNTPVASPGNGFYPDTVIQVSCYQAGAGNVPGSADNMWEQASWVSGQGSGSGWINEHFINDGAAINQPSPGTPACAGAPPPPPPAQTWSEQETPNHPVNTFTNYHNASGMGPAIAAGQWVQVSCKVYDPYIASVNPDGYWYRIASSPWNNAYYSPANTFMNGDPYGGPYTHNTDFAVPNC